MLWHRRAGKIIAYLIWKGSYNNKFALHIFIVIIAYLIWKGSYNIASTAPNFSSIIAYLIWKGSYNRSLLKMLKD